MKTSTDKPAPETAEQVRAAAEAWFRRQVETLRLSLGDAWPEHRDWIIDNLREEARQRLIARGWRPRNG
jgi:hypothetical protein